MNPSYLRFATITILNLALFLSAPLLVRLVSQLP